MQVGDRVCPRAGSMMALVHGTGPGTVVRVFHCGIAPGSTCSGISQDRRLLASRMAHWSGPHRNPNAFGV